MFSEILTNQICEGDFGTSWIPLQIDRLNPRCTGYKARCLYISWEEADGELDGELVVLGGDAEGFVCLGAKVPLDKPQSAPDDWLIKIDPVCSYLKLQYYKRGINRIKLNAVIQYEEER